MRAFTRLIASDRQTTQSLHHVASTHFPVPNSLREGDFTARCGAVCAPSPFQTFRPGARTAFFPGLMSDLAARAAGCRVDCQVRNICNASSSKASCTGKSTPTIQLRSAAPASTHKAAATSMFPAGRGVLSRARPSPRAGRAACAARQARPCAYQLFDQRSGEIAERLAACNPARVDDGLGTPDAASASEREEIPQCCNVP